MIFGSSQSVNSKGFPLKQPKIIGCIYSHFRKKKIKITCDEDATLLRRFVEKNRIYEFVIGLNIKFDAMRVQILGKENLFGMKERSYA